MFSGFYDNRGLRGSLIVSCFSLELITADVALCNDQLNQVDEFKRKKKRKAKTRLKISTRYVTRAAKQFQMEA